MTVTRALPGRTDLLRVDYPESDGKPLAETGIHVQRIFDLVNQFQRQLFWRRPDVYVGANMFMYYEEGNPRAVVAPDFFVQFAVSSNEPRRTLKLWVEGGPPAVIVEVTSRSTRREDLVRKRQLYERLGVAEYYLFDPLQEYLKPHFQGFVPDAGRYRACVPDAEGGIVSAALGVRLWPDGPYLQATELRSGVRLLLFHESGPISGGTVEDHSLMSELVALHMARADAAAARAEAERARADQEQVRAVEAERELARLRAELARLQSG